MASFIQHDEVLQILVKHGELLVHPLDILADGIAVSCRRVLDFVPSVIDDIERIKGCEVHLIHHDDQN